MQTRSKFRLLQQAVAQAPMEESISSPPKALKEEKQTKKKEGSQPLQLSSSPSVDVSVTPTAGVVDDKSNVNDTEQEHVDISTSVPCEQSVSQSES